MIGVTRDINVKITSVSTTINSNNAGTSMTKKLSRLKPITATIAEKIFKIELL